MESERILDLGHGIKLGGDNPCVLLLDAGVNHNNDVRRAMELIKTAADAGAHVIKFQTYTADEISTRKAPRYWDPKLDTDGGGTQHAMFSKVDKLPASAYPEMKAYADSLGIVFSSSPFGVESAEFLIKLDMGVYKIASAELTNEPVLKIVAESGKPMILSTGASSIGEVESALEIVEKAGNRNIALQHCVLSYPCKDEDVNLVKMERLKAIFPTIPVGYSDHTYGNMPTLAAIAMGARSIEKHYTVDNSLPDSPDHGFSLNPADLADLVRDAKRIHASRGVFRHGHYDAEHKALMYARKSIIVVSPVAAGEVIEARHLATKRPGTGIYPHYLPAVIGRTARVAIAADTILSWEMI